MCVGRRIAGGVRLIDEVETFEEDFGEGGAGEFLFVLLLGLAGIGLGEGVAGLLAVPKSSAVLATPVPSLRSRLRSGWDADAELAPSHATPPARAADSAAATDSRSHATRRRSGTARSSCADPVRVPTQTASSRPPRCSLSKACSVVHAHAERTSVSGMSPV